MKMIPGSATINDRIHHLAPKAEQKSWNEPAHEIMPFFVLRKLILQTHMRSHAVGLDVWFVIGPLVYFHLSLRTSAIVQLIF